jgi:hypothetical protein
MKDPRLHPRLHLFLPETVVAQPYLWYVGPRLIRAHLKVLLSEHGWKRGPYC